ncbi:alpha/beta fold hydrolase [Streptomyces rimosus]|uniref:alpha/beta fold hydrolase n=1 Tax=Streptomyces rimosus TaxID=1927 RepID=UPI0037CE5230
MNDHVDTAALRIAYDVSGPPDGRPVVAVHGRGARVGYVVGALFPDRISALVAISAGDSTSRPDNAVPYSLPCGPPGHPGWGFADADFEQAAEAWDNPDWADITVHAYLHRWGEAPGDPAYQDIEDRLADPPPVRVPTLVLHGEQDGDNRAGTTEGQEGLFAGPYERVLLPGIGHFPPREAPRATADAIQHLMS